METQPAGWCAPSSHSLSSSATLAQQKRKGRPLPPLHGAIERGLRPFSLPAPDGPSMCSALRPSRGCTGGQQASHSRAF